MEHNDTKGYFKASSVIFSCHRVWTSSRVPNGCRAVSRTKWRIKERSSIQSWEVVGKAAFLSSSYLRVQAIRLQLGCHSRMLSYQERLTLLGDGFSRLHSSARRTQFRQGACSSHWSQSDQPLASVPKTVKYRTLTRRRLQLMHPFLDFL